MSCLIYLAVIIHVSLYVIVFEQPKIAAKKLLGECFEGKWCENGSEHTKKNFSSTRDSHYIEVIAVKFCTRVSRISITAMVTFLSKSNFCSNKIKVFGSLFKCFFCKLINSNPFKWANWALKCNFFENLFQNKQNTKCVGKKTLSKALNKWVIMNLTAK